MAKEIKLSKKSLEDLKKELEYLQTVREKEVAEELKVARSFGDLSENSEYEEAKNNQARLYARKAELEEILAHAVIIEDTGDGNSVSMSSVVTIQDLENGDEDRYELVGSQEADPMHGKISDESPLGRALLGRSGGDEVEVEAPAGVLRYKIVAIEK